MVLGIPYIVWVSVLGAIAIWLAMSNTTKKKNKNTEEERAAYDNFQKSLEEMAEMRWVNIKGVLPDQVVVLLNKIEVAKITVMYQFFIRNNTYDMFFRCRKNQQEELKKILDLE